MATPVIMPRQGQSVESCILAKWAKQPGDAVAEGDLLSAENFCRRCRYHMMY